MAKGSWREVAARQKHEAHGKKGAGQSPCAAMCAAVALFDVAVRITDRRTVSKTVRIQCYRKERGRAKLLRCDACCRCSVRYAAKIRHRHSIPSPAQPINPPYHPKKPHGAGFAPWRPRSPAEAVQNWGVRFHAHEGASRTEKHRPGVFLRAVSSKK